MRNISYIIIHHSVSSRDMDKDQAIALLDRSHKRKLHWWKNSKGLYIAYHYVILGNGEVVNTRDIKEIGHHAGVPKINNDGIGICLTGNFEKELPSEAQYKSLAKLIRDLKIAYPDAAILKHKDVKATACPGKFDINKVKKLINRQTASKFTKYLNDEIKQGYKPLFTKHEGESTLNEREVRELLEIGFARLERRITNNKKWTKLSSS